MRVHSVSAFIRTSPLPTGFFNPPSHSTHLLFSPSLVVSLLTLSCRSLALVQSIWWEFGAGLLLGKIRINLYFQWENSWATNDTIDRIDRFFSKWEANSSTGWMYQEFSSHYKDHGLAGRVIKSVDLRLELISFNWAKFQITNGITKILMFFFLLADIFSQALSHWSGLRRIRINYDSKINFGLIFQWI